MNKKDKIESLYQIISNAYAEEELKEKSLKKHLNEVTESENKFFKDLSRTKIREYIQLNDLIYYHQSEVLEKSLKFAIEFILDFYNL